MHYKVGILIRHDLDRIGLILALAGDLIWGVRMTGEEGNIRERDCLCLCRAVGSIWIFHSIFINNCREHKQPLCVKELLPDNSVFLIFSVFHTCVRWLSTGWTKLTFYSLPSLFRNYSEFCHFILASCINIFRLLLRVCFLPLMLVHNFWGVQ